MIQKLIKLWRSAQMYVIADPRDNSITFSKRLFRHIRRHALSGVPAQAYVFSMKEYASTNHKELDPYAFVISPETEQELWPLCDIQVNDKYHTIGFESLCPTVNKICYDYGLDYDTPHRLPIHVLRVYDKIVYIMKRP